MIDYVWGEGSVRNVIVQELIKQGLDWQQDGRHFIVEGRHLTAGSVAELYYPGGWEAAWAASNAWSW
jgi:hypothetical protein